MTAERIGVFGGTFDPPHLGHRCVARSAADQFELSRVLWIPAARSPRKKRQVGSRADLRLDMTKLCLADDKRFEISKIELDRGGISYMVDTLEQLNRLYLGARLFLILGADSFSSFDSWRDPERISELARIIVYPRSDFKNEDARTDGHLGNDRSGTVTTAQWMDMDKIDISSSDIRSRIADGQRVKDLLSGPVYEYIISNRLYQNS